MESFIEEINWSLCSQVADFETKFGDVETFYIKQSVSCKHIMDLKDIFLSPDLIGLENYERLLSGGHKAR